MTTLAIYSNKGGVGKTATAVNLAYLGAASGYSTLIVDLDPQSSATYYFRVKPRLKRRARGLIRSSNAIDKSIKGTDYENLDLLPADFTHRKLDITFDALRRRKQRLNIVFEPLRREYDLIVIDCPPTINVLAENIFNAADYLLVPLIPTTLSVRTHEQLLKFLRTKGYANKHTYGFFSMVDSRKKMHREMMPKMAKNFSGILRSPIPYLSIIERMGIYREPVPASAPESIAAQAYKALWNEISTSIISVS